MASPTPNKGYTYPAHGGAVNAWDTPLNQNFDLIDLNVGGYWAATISSTIVGVTYYSSGAAASSTAATLTISTSLAANLNYEFSGTLTQNLQVVMPSEGALYTFKNNLSGSFTMEVGTSSSAGVIIQPGGSNVVACDGTIIYLADSNQGSAQFDSYLGNPNGFVDGVVASVNGGLTDPVWDVTNRQLYITTSSSNSSWAPQLPRLTPEGILTANNSTTSPVVTSDTTATTIYYTPYSGNWTVLSTGTILFPYQFSQMSLALTAAQAANQIYDIFMWWNGGSPIIGTGTAWSTATAGSGSRGSGGSTTQLARLQGILVNANAMNLFNGASTYACPANEGVYLGSIFMDSSAGAVTCHRSTGQSRKWGVWNNYNRGPVNLILTDSTSSWTYGSATWRQSNGSTANVCQTFFGLSEVSAVVTFDQLMLGVNGTNVRASIGIGVNSTTDPTMLGSGGTVKRNSDTYYAVGRASAVLTPRLGLNNINAIESVPDAANTSYLGGAGDMIMSVGYLA